MPAWLVVQENASGEWCVTDLDRGYRVCAYHHRVHGGVHLHAFGRAPKTVPVGSAAEAKAIMRAYAAGHEAYKETTFLAEVNRWRSASRSG